jgi:hypothetical protein
MSSVGFVRVLRAISADTTAHGVFRNSFASVPNPLEALSFTRAYIDRLLRWPKKLSRVS